MERPEYLLSRDDHDALKIGREIVEAMKTPLLPGTDRKCLTLWWNGTWSIYIEGKFPKPKQRRWWRG
jgi:hypothetical protein